MNNLELIDTLIKEKKTSIDVHKNILETDNSRRWFHNKMIKECEEHIEILFKIKSELEEYQKLKDEKTPQKPVKGKIIYNSFENIQTYEEKETAKKPVIKTIKDEYNGEFYDYPFCPVCDNCVEHIANYCDTCGQKVG